MEVDNQSTDHSESEVAEVDPVVEIIQKDGEAIDAILSEEKRKLSLPAVGEQFTEEQDAAVFEMLDEVIDEFYKTLDGDLDFEEAFLEEGVFMTWLYGTQPFTRGASDIDAVLGTITWTVEDVLYGSFAVLDFELGSVYMTVPVEWEETVIEVQDEQDTPEEITKKS